MRQPATAIVGCTRAWWVPPPLMVETGSSTLCVLVCDFEVPRSGTMNGSLQARVCRHRPFAIRFMVFSTRASSRKIVRPSSSQSMHSAAERQAFWPLAGFLWYCAVGQTIGLPSRRAMPYRRLRMVGAPWSAATRTW
ncbi:hypothetical protein D3C81_1357640 [compost metagenome]